MQEFKQETIWWSFIAHDLHKVKLINHNCFLWPSCSKTSMFTRAAARSGEPDTNPELGNLLMLLCIPIFQVTRYPYQEGSRWTQFKNLGLRPKVVHIRHNPPAQKQAPNTALNKLEVSGTSCSTSPLKAFSFCLFLRLGSRALLHQWVSFPPHAQAGLVRAADSPALAGRGSPYRLPSPQELHFNRELGEGHRGKIWQPCIGLQGFSIKEIENTNTQQHPRMQTIPYPFDTDLFLRNRGAAAVMPRHKQTPATNCKDSQAHRVVIIFRVHV